jgi:hypothetical protein
MVAAYHGVPDGRFFAGVRVVAGDARRDALLFAPALIW